MTPEQRQRLRKSLTDALEVIDSVEAEEAAYSVESQGSAIVVSRGNVICRIYQRNDDRWNLKIKGGAQTTFSGDRDGAIAKAKSLIDDGGISQLRW